MSCVLGNVTFYPLDHGVIFKVGWGCKILYYIIITSASSLIIVPLCNSNQHLYYFAITQLHNSLAHLGITLPPNPIKFTCIALKLSHSDRW